MHYGSLQGWVLLNCLATWAMIGVIWIVQMVHYPLLGYGLTEASDATLQTLQQLSVTHAVRIGKIVLPLMLLEAFTTGLLTLHASGWLKLGVTAPAFNTLVWVGTLLLAGIWASTFFWQVPLHHQLQQAGSVAQWQRLHLALVASNGLRTILWTLRGGTSVSLLWLLFTSPSTP